MGMVKEQMIEEARQAQRVMEAAPAMLEALLEIAWECDGRDDIDWNGNPNLAMKILALAEPAIKKAGK